MLRRDQLVALTQAHIAPASERAAEPPYAPPIAAEYAYYGIVFYSVLGSAIGLSINLVGAATLFALSAYCMIRLKPARAISLCAPIAAALACACSYLLIQMLWYGTDLDSGREPLPKAFITWMAGLIVAQALSWRRGFLHRFAFATFVIGCAALPFAKIRVTEVERLGLDSSSGLSGELANPNGLAAYFGFCYLYFMILGLETKRYAVRAVAWMLAAGCLLLVALTISRGTLLALGIATVIASHRLLKKGFVPVLVLMIAGWVLYLSGIFDHAIASYEARGLVESGRGAVWPIIVRRFLDSPFVGVGGAKSATWVPAGRVEITPHNSFLFLALAGGVVPLLFFVAYWVRAGIEAFRAYAAGLPDSQFQIPMVTYAFLIALAGASPYMSAWAIVSLAVPLAAGAARKPPKLASARAAGGWRRDAELSRLKPARR